MSKISDHMFNKCIVPGCSSTGQTIHLHRFPKGENRRAIWLNNIGCENLKTLSFACLRNKFVCDLHFDPIYFGKTCRILKRNAIPTIFDVQDCEDEVASPTHEDVDEIKQDETEGSMLSDTADSTTAEETLYTGGVNIKLETVDDVNQPLITSITDEYEAMCMEIIGEMPEDPPSPQETPLDDIEGPHQATIMAESEAQPSQPVPSRGPAAAAPKRPRSTVPLTSREPDPDADEEHIAAAIIDTRHALGHISERTEGLLREYLYRLLDQAILQSQGTFAVLEFRGWSYHDGIFQVRCADARARDWLAEAVSRMPGQNLSVVSVEVQARLVRASIWVPDEMAPVAEIKRRLDRYAAHQGLNTSSWRVYQHIAKQRPRGTLLVLGVPVADVARVMGKGGHIMYRLDALKVIFTEPESQGRINEPLSSSAN